jgi:hypothetical protein
MSISVVRNGVVFGYVGCVIGKFGFTIDNGTLMFNVSIVGQDEATQSLPTPTWTATEVPYGAGSYSVQIPTASQIFDADTFDFEVDDNATPQFRLKSASRGAQFISYGERSVTLSTARDFQSRTEYDAFKALTAQAITILASKGVNNSIQLDMGVAIKDTYTVPLSGEGDLTRADIAYNAVIDNTGNAYTVTVKTQESIT